MWFMLFTCMNIDHGDVVVMNTSFTKEMDKQCNAI